MPQPIIEVQNLSKLYELGTIGGRTLRESLERGWYRMRGKEHLLHKIGAKHQMVGPDHPQAGPRPNTMWALKDVSFEVKEGEVLGIIGRNGAGKSTLLKLLTRITEPTSGRALVYGRVASLLEVGTGFHPELTGRENIYLNGAVLGMKKAEVARKFDEIVAFSEVEQFIDTPVKRYSSGMYVRLAFAVAAHLDPEVLLVDEVLAVGDAAFQKKCLGKMGDVAKGGRTVLFVSHNLPSIQALCPRTILVERGRVAAGGVTSEVIGTYLSVGKESIGRIDLSHYTGRTYSSEYAIKEAWIESAEGVTCNHVLMGGSLTLCYSFEFSREIHLPGFGFGVENAFGQRMFSVNNYTSGVGLRGMKTCRRGTVRCIMPSIPLQPGRYHVSLSLVEGQRTFLDYIERIISFDVEPADVFGSGKIYEPSQGLFYVPAQMVMEE
jgi:lipopolysaccharide transport system ATP-binding protein